MGLNPADGVMFPALEIDEHRSSGRMSKRQFFASVPDPRLADVHSEDQALQEIALVRAQVQRPFENAKKANVLSYRNYITDMTNGKPGITPAIILYSPTTLPHEFDEYGVGRILLPYGQPICILDGETQTAARFDAKSDPATQNGFLAIEVVHGVSVEIAAQMYHDLNVLGVRPSPALAMSRDQRDTMTAITRQVAALPIFHGRVDFTSRQLKRKSANIITLTALRGAVVCFGEGIGGVRFGVKPVAVATARIAPLESGALLWFKALADKIGPVLEGDRDKLITGGPAIFAALGALGFGIEKTAEADRPAAIATRLAKLDGVKWDRASWVGIAGKQTPKGKITLGGSKEVAYAVYAALSDPNSPAYPLVRQ
jgi:DNA sulfur modification protein DndB